jgi:uncharacterized phiE125 gp8 family phage protein
MIQADPIAVDPQAIDETKAYLRIAGEAEDDVIERLLAAAIGHGEGFTGQALIAREMCETIPAQCGWRRLGRSPVGAIASVAGLPASGAGFALGVDAYAVDVDAAGDGWVRINAAGTATRAEVTYTAGLAGEWSGLPEPLRQGIIRLAGHLYTHRDAADEGAPPAAVAALWRPWRRMRLA